MWSSSAKHCQYWLLCSQTIPYGLAKNTPKLQKLIKKRPKSSICLNIFHFLTLTFFLGPLTWNRPTSLFMLVFIIFKKSKIDFKKFTFRGGTGGRSRPIWKKNYILHFFWTLPLLSSGTQKALLDMKLNFHLIKRQNKTFFY